MNYSVFFIITIITLSAFSIILSGSVRKYIQYSVTIIIFNLSKLFPRTKRIVVFGSECGKVFGGNPKYLFIYANKYECIKSVWITKNKQTINEIRGFGYECYYYKSLKGLYYQLRAKTFINSHSITDDFNRYLLGGSAVINTWHGVGLKTVWFLRKTSFSYRLLHDNRPIIKYFSRALLNTTITRDYYLIATSPAVASYYPETFLVKKENVLELGQARNDMFFNEELKSDNFPDYFKEYTVITYMPTHRNYGRTDQGIEKVLNLESLDRICSKYNCKFIIKRHLHSRGKLQNNYKNINDVTYEDLDTQLILKYTDILITDYSSCYTDFLLLNRPVIFYCYDYENYIENMRDMYFEYNEVTPGPKVFNYEDLELKVIKVLEGKDEFKNERQRVLDIFYSKENQTTVCEKQINFILDNIIKIKR